MNRLRIVVEEKGNEEFEVVFCGIDRAAADAALHKPTTRNRALYVKPQVSAFNRPIIAPAKAAPKSEPAPETEAPKSKKK